MRAEVRKVAAEVFAAGTADASSLQDVADRMGISRSALYRYFPSRDALVIEIVEEHSDRARKIVVETDPNCPPEVRLPDLVRALASFALEHPATTRMVDTIWPVLPDSAREIVRDLNRSFFASLRAVIVDGIESGVFRDVDPGVAAQSAASVTRSLAIWFDPEGRLSADEVVEQIASIAVAGLLAPTAATAAVLGSAREAAAATRAELDRLERILGRSGMVDEV
ncbi:TetR/AcrR family transcriptional regulator [Prescottella equi]